MNWTGEKIKELRLRLGWSQAEFARRLGCRQQTVSEWETNIYQPQNAYSQLLDRFFDELLNDENAKTADREIVEPENSFDLGID